MTSGRNSFVHGDWMNPRMRPSQNGTAPGPQTPPPPRGRRFRRGSSAALIDRTRGGPEKSRDDQILPLTLERAWKNGVARSAVGVGTETGRESDGGNEDALRGDRNRGLRSRIPLHGRFWMGGPTPYERSMTVLDRHRRPAPSAGTETTGLGRRGVSTR
jgi:hypothetical protein